VIIPLTLHQVNRQRYRRLVLCTARTQTSWTARIKEEISVRRNVSAISVPTPLICFNSAVCG
jgi:hypothetical protein